MTTRRKLTAREAFDLNMADAQMLVDLAALLQNDRTTRRMRRELRERIGRALKVPQKSWSELECLENDEIFITFKPGAGDWRGRLVEENLRPLLRQAIVAVGAAVETFVADRVMERYADALKTEPLPPRLLGLTMTVEDWLRIEKTYERKHWGLRQIVEHEVRQRASAAPSVIGELFSMVGESKLFRRIDAHRRVALGTSEAQLETITKRRNRVAHEGDRAGRGRAVISIPEVADYVGQANSIIGALDDVTAPKAPKR